LWQPEYWILSADGQPLDVADGNANCHNYVSGFRQVFGGRLEFGFILIVCLSAAAGLALRGSVSRRLRRVLLALGIGALVATCAVIGLIAFSHGRVLGFWSGGMLALGLVCIAALVLPFTLAVSWGRWGQQ